MTSEVLPSIRKTGKYETPIRPTIPPEEIKLRKQEAEIRLKEAQNERAKLLLEIGNRTEIREYKQLIDSYAGNILMEKRVASIARSKN